MSKKLKPLPSLEVLHEYFLYNPESGELTWKKRPNNRVGAGQRAGTLTSRGYLRVGLFRRQCRSQRIIFKLMTGEDIPSGFEIDHKNGDRADNRWDNLRLCKRSQNRANSKKPKNNTSGFKGVYFDKRARKFVAMIRVDCKSIYLGGFTTPEEAHEAYKEAALKHFGDFARFE